jgi:splicing factor U2AF subunit
VTISTPSDLHARRLYVGGVPITTSPDEVVKFLNDTIKHAGGIIEPGDPILKSINNLEKRFVFLELRSVEETTAMLQLDGIKYKDAILRIRRPPDYEKFPEVKPKRPIPQIETVKLGIISTKVEESPFKVFIGGLPKEFSED